MRNTNETSNTIIFRQKLYQINTLGITYAIMNAKENKIFNKNMRMNQEIY